MPNDLITVFLADDNLLVREGVRALVGMHADLQVVGTASDYEGLVAGAEKVGPQVLVTDIRMPPNFETEGIDAARQIRKRHPATGVVVLSQYDDPDYAVSFLSGGAEGCAYLLKDRIAEGDQLARAIRAVATGGSMLDTCIVNALVTPVAKDETLSSDDEDLLRLIAEGRHVKAIAAVQATTPEAAAATIERLFLKIAQSATAGGAGALRHLRTLHRTIVEREELGETLSRLLPGGVAEKLRHDGMAIGQTEELTVTVLMSDIRGYSMIAELADPAQLAGQLNEHRSRMCDAILANAGTVMHFIGDAVMGVFGAPWPQDDHADRAVAAATAMHGAQAEVNRRWAKRALPEFRLGIGLSTGVVAAALLGSDQRLEYSIVGDSVNLTQRLQQWANGGESMLSEATFRSLRSSIQAERLEPARVKGRRTPVVAYRLKGPDGVEPRVPRKAHERREQVSVRVLIVDDQEPFRTAARAVVEATGGFEVVGEAETGEETLEAVERLDPDLVLMDINLPGIDGMEATRRIRAFGPDDRVVLLLSTYEESDYGSQAVECGAAAFIPKSEFGPQRLAEAWADVAR